MYTYLYKHNYGHSGWSIVSSWNANRQFKHRHTRTHTQEHTINRWLPTICWLDYYALRQPTDAHTHTHTIVRWKSRTTTRFWETWESTDDEMKNWYKVNVDNLALDVHVVRCGMAAVVTVEKDLKSDCTIQIISKPLVKITAQLQPAPR